MFSIIIPTLNNLKYLKLCLKSIEKNSSFKHEIILHISVGEDGTLDFAKSNKIKYSFTEYNAGICEGVNTAAKLSSKEYILYSHDDFYFLPKWDQYLIDEIERIGHNHFYLSGTMMHKGQVPLDCGDTIENFNEMELFEKNKKILFDDFQGSTWAPHLLHKKLWDRVGGFSEEYFPGTGSDPDLNMKLWREKVRIFKGLGKCRVYHFGSIVTRDKYKKEKFTTESGSKGSKIFLLKWGITIKFFIKYYLNGTKTINDVILCNKYNGPLNEPIKDFSYLLSLSLVKIYYLYTYLKKLIK